MRWGRHGERRGERPGGGRRTLVVAVALVALTCTALGVWAVAGADGDPPVTEIRRIGRDDRRAARPPVTYESGPQLAAALATPGGPAPVVSRVPTTDRVLFLGIDDGLVRDHAVLQYLQRKNMPYTSFLVAGPLEIDPGFWSLSRLTGGTVQAHTIRHPNLTKLSAGEVRDELCGSADFIEDMTGVRPTLFRPPYGAYNEMVQAIAAECGYAAIVMWMGTVNGELIELQEPALQPGDILLLHWREDLLASLKTVRARAQAEGFTIARLEDYLLPLP